ncbi:hypothetical protein ACFYNO_33045 [Kitasatospora sp. NPDC006697]|uniref:hypothetical protein n=1 Tax=Kitasatospora sp. NPDC006697 TaxID=3364020 RepID=UPI00367671D7
MDIRHPLITGTPTSGKTSLRLILEAEAAARASGAVTGESKPAAPALPAAGRDDRYADATASLMIAQALVALRGTARGSGQPVVVIDEAPYLLAAAGPAGDAARTALLRVGRTNP